MNFNYDWNYYILYHWMENFSIIFYKIKVRMIANYKHVISLYEINHMQIDINETRYLFCVINFT